MANTIRIKRSAVQGKVPAVGDLSLGELALNTYDGKLYTLKNDGTDSVIEIGANVGGNFSTDISLQNQSATRYYEDSANGTNYIAIRAPSSLSADVVLTLPTTDGDADQVLGTDGNGNLSWVSRVSGSGTSGDFLSTSTASEQSGYFGNIFLKDDSNTSHYLEITNSDDLTALRTLSIDVNDANRSVILSGNLNLANNFTTSGNFALTLTTTASTNVTLPTSGTLATLSGTEQFSNKSFSDNVGIGTTSPGAELDVRGGANIGDGTTTVRTVGASGVGFVGTSTNHPLAFRINNVETARIDSSGRLLVGTSSTSGNITDNDKLAVVITGEGTQGGISITEYAGVSATIGSYAALRLQRSIGSTDGSFTALTASNWGLGRIEFNGSNGVGFGTGARIDGIADALAWGDGDHPARLEFSTTADGASSPTERLRITSTGAWGLSGANYGNAGQVLTSNGSGSAPTWQDGGGGGVDALEVMLFG